MTGEWGYLLVHHGVEPADSHPLHVEPTDKTQPFESNKGYYVIPKPVVADYAKARNLVS